MRKLGNALKTFNWLFAACLVVGIGWWLGVAGAIYYNQSEVLQWQAATFYPRNNHAATSAELGQNGATRPN